MSSAEGLVKLDIESKAPLTCITFIILLVIEQIQTDGRSNVWSWCSHFESYLSLNANAMLTYAHATLI